MLSIRGPGTGPREKATRAKPAGSAGENHTTLEDDEREIGKELGAIQFSEDEENAQVTGADEVPYYTNTELTEHEVCDSDNESSLDSSSSLKRPYNHTVEEVGIRSYKLS